MTPLKLRFWSKVATHTKKSACWLWLACKDKDGYGQFKLNGKQEKAHRVSWLVSNGRIPNGIWVLHRCDNPSCVRPNHFWLGTNKENQADMYRKGRGNKVCGEQQGSAKLTLEKVLEMRRMHSLGYPSTTLGLLFGVSRSNAWLICAGKIWKHSV